MRVCEWFCISSRQLTSLHTGTLQAGWRSVLGCLRPVSLVIRPPFPWGMSKQMGKTARHKLVVRGIVMTVIEN